MDNRIEDLENRMGQLSQRVLRLEERLEALGARSSVDTEPRPTHESASSTPTSIPTGTTIVVWLTLAGRTCLVLGGAFLIRALTDGGQVTKNVGACLGLAFAAIWAGFLHRALTRENKASAAFHGVAAVLIAYPLIVETATRLAALSAPTAVLCLGGFTALLLAIAWRDRFSFIAYLAMIACLVTSLALYVLTNVPRELALLLLLLLAAALVVAQTRSWNTLPWLVAPVADVILLREVFTVTRLGPADSLASALTLASSTALGAISIASLIHGTFLRRNHLRTFDMAQSAAAIAVWVAGAVNLMPLLGLSTSLAGWAAFAGALGALFVALRIIPLHRDRGVDFVFYSGLGVALLFLGGELATAPPFRGLLWAILALVAALIGHRLQPVALWVYAATLAWGAGLSAGVSALAQDGFLGSAADPWAPLQVPLLIMVGLVGTSWFVTAVKPARSTLPYVVERLPPGALLLLTAVSVAALINYTVHVLLGGQRADPALLATGRTLSIVAVATALALAQRTRALPELGWIAYAMLAMGALKLVVEDLPHGRAVTLLVGFTAFGGALIAVPKLLAQHASRA